MNEITEDYGRFYIKKCYEVDAIYRDRPMRITLLLYAIKYSLLQDPFKIMSLKTMRSFRSLKIDWK